MKGFLLAILLLSAAGSCDAAIKEWTEKERHMYSVYLTLSAVDTYQTFEMIDCQKQPHCGLIERNPILGKRPSKGAVLGLKVAGNMVIYRMLDNRTVDREKALFWLNFAQGFVVANNGIYWYKEFK